MASFDQHTQSGGATSRAFSIPSFTSDEIKVRVDNVLKTATTHYNITSYTVNGGTVTWTSGNIPANGSVIRIYRDTNILNNAGSDVEAKATYQAGSSVKADDLNDNQQQVLRALLEKDDQLIQKYDIEAGAVGTDELKADAVTGAKIANDAIDSEHYTDGSIDLQHLASNSVDTSKIVNGTITNDDISGSTAIDGSKIAASTTSAPGTISAADKTKLDGIEDNAKDDQTAAEIRVLVEAASNSNVFTDADHSKLNGIADNATGDQTLSDLSSLGVATLTGSETLTNKTLTSPVINGMSGTAVVTSGTSTSDTKTYSAKRASELFYAKGTADDIEASGVPWSGNDSTIATTAAIDKRIVDIVDDVGGFVALADEGEIPQNHPEKENTDTADRVGTILSIGVIDKTGGYTTANGRRSGTTVTIDASDLTNHSNDATITDCNVDLPEGFGVLVETTAQTDVQYTAGPSFKFHRLVPKATEVTTVAGKATEIGRLGTADAVADLALLGTAAVVEDLNLLGTSAAVADMALLGDSAVIADMATIADTSNLITNIGTVAAAATNVNNVGGSITNVNTVAGNLSGVNSFGERYRAATNNAGEYSSNNDVGDLYFNTTINALKVWNGSAWVAGITSTGNYALVTGNTFTGANTYNDNVKVKFGTGNDLELYHDATDNQIKSVNGKVVITTTAGNSDIEITPHGSGVVKLDGLSWPTADGSANQYLKTNGSGALSWGTVASDVVGDTTPQLGGNLDVNTKNIVFGDSSDGSSDDVLKFGAGTDLSIYHDGSTSNLIKSAAGQTLGIHAATTWFRNAANSETTAKFIEDGAVELYYDNSKKFETTANGIQVGSVTIDSQYNHLKFPDSGEARFGAGEDLKIYHNGSHSYITNSTGDLYLKTAASSAVSILDNNDDTIFRAVDDGAVELYYDNSKKFETTSTGTKTTGKSEIDGDVQWNGSDNSWGAYWDKSANSLAFKDSKKITLGTGNDLELWHDGTDTTIKNSTGELHVRGDTLVLASASTYEKYLKGVKDGAVELYHNNSKKFFTLSDGVEVDGHVYLMDNDILKIGSGSDLQIYHDANHSYIKDNGTGAIKIVGDDVRITDAAGNNIIKGTAAAAELYYDGSKKLNTGSGGIVVSGSYYTNDSNKIYLGSDNDLEIYHDGSDSYITNTSATDLIIKNTGNAGILIQNQNSYPIELKTNAEDAIKCNANGSVDLFYDNSKKLETTSGGVSITGALLPAANDTHDLGSSSYAWNNLYVNDLHFSNNPDNPNSVDGTWGDWTLQEGEEDIFMINNRSGKKYKMALQEVS